MAFVCRSLLAFVVLPFALRAQRPRTAPAQRPSTTAGVIQDRTVWTPLVDLAGPPVAPAAVAAIVSDSGRHHRAGRYALTGLGIGAVAGIVGGAVGSRYAGCGCSNTEKTVGFALWFGAIGAGAGAIVGAITGVIADAVAP